MNTRSIILRVGSLLLAIAAMAFAGSPDDKKPAAEVKKPAVASVKPSDTAKADTKKPVGRTFITLPVLPSCMQLSPDHGDPFKTGATIFLKVAAGCKVQWHWHTAGESLLMVNGNAVVEMKGMESHKLASGDHVYLSAKGIHQFTCTNGCTLWDITEGAFDIHYVDKDGKEIPVDQVIKPVAAKTPAK